MAERFRLSDFAYAHRGLWSPGGPTENCLEALLLASEMGLGIEFDVRPTQDGVPVIFHDPLLNRLTALQGYVAHYSSEELVGAPLIGGGRIISLQTLLGNWPAKTPLLCELKIDGETDPVAFARRVGDMLLTHQGPVAAMSFDPVAVAALPADLMRGQLITPSEISGESHLTATAECPVDYFACHVSDAENATLQYARPEVPLITWTVKDPDTCEALSSLTDSQIFEGFDPGLAKRLILNR